MLAAIGIILILKQIPHAFGYDEDYVGDFSFEQVNKENTFSQILNLLSKSHQGAIIISVVSIFILIIWEKRFMRKINAIPGPLVVVLVGIFLNTLIFSNHSIYGLSGNHLVNIPVINNADEFLNLFILPDFSQIFNNLMINLAKYLENPNQKSLRNGN
jgi:carbonic anhydrase